MIPRITEFVASTKSQFFPLRYICHWIWWKIKKINRNTSYFIFQCEIKLDDPIVMRFTHLTFGLIVILKKPQFSVLYLLSQKYSFLHWMKTTRRNILTFLGSRNLVPKVNPVLFDWMWFQGNQVNLSFFRCSSSRFSHLHYFLSAFNPSQQMKLFGLLPPRCFSTWKPCGLLTG